MNPDSITLRHLLSHTHGINGDGPVVWRTAFTGVHTNALLKELLRHHGPSDAGSGYRYTNLGYNIAVIIIDDITRGKWQDELARQPALIDRVKGRIAEDRSRRAARPQTLNRPLEAYAGTYQSPEGGTMTWTVRDGKLWAEIGVLKSVAEVFDYQTDRLRVELEPGTGEVIRFQFEDDRATGLLYSNRHYVRK